MSKFKVKKIPSAKQYATLVKKSNTLKATDDASEEIPKKKVRKIVLIGLILMTIIFGINYVVHGIAGMKIGTADIGGTFSRIVGQNVAEEKKGTTNILLVGIGGQWHQAWELADSIMLASLDEVRGSVTMISIPRDLYVAYPEKMGAGKINSLYPLGISHKVGIQWLAEKVSDITGQSIDHYAVIDFTAFRYIVNALWGVEVDVEKDIYDREYPDYNWGYTVFSLKKWLQNLDGETALRYARSRHSTSDTDRSRRQQQLIAAIKSKALSLGIITNPGKIGELIDATRKNISTDLTVGDIVNYGLKFKDIDKNHIHTYNLNSDCYSYTNCVPGAYVYQPSMAYFGGAWAVIPDGASMSRLSFYDNIRRFVSFIFAFPGIHTQEQPIVMVATSKSQSYAKSVLMEMGKIGINYDEKRVLKVSTGAIDHSHINIYWNAEHKIGINPDSEIVQALKKLDETMPINIVQNNEYITDDGPKIEIVLGADATDYYEFAKPLSYLPKIDTPKTVSGEASSTPITKPNPQIITPTSSSRTPATKTTPPVKSTSTESTRWPYPFNPGDIEDFGTGNTVH